MEAVLEKAGLSYSMAVCSSAGSEKFQSVPKSDAEKWIIAIEKGSEPLQWENEGPFILLNKGDVSKKVARLLRIETK